MKSTHIFLSFLIGTMMLTGCNRTPKVPEGEFLIEGELKNVPDSVVIMLMKGEGTLLSTVAMDTVNQGKFALRGSISSIESQKYDLLCFDDGFPITQQYAGKMEVVSINQSSKEAWKDFVEKKGLKGNQWNELRSGNTGLAAAYQVRGIPHYVMISPEGKVKSIWAGYGPGTLKAKVKELIK